jgi:hypothetical protein
MVLEINAFPEEEEDAEKEGGVGWLHSVAGPLIALLKVRTSTQLARNDAELELLRCRCERHGVTLERIPLRFEAAEETEFRGVGDTYKPPLSWKLTTAQKQEILDAWERLVEDHPEILEPLDQIWGS